MVTAGRVTRLTRIGLTVADLDRSEAFFRDGLGFERHGPASPDTRTMRLGAETIELTAFDPPGRPYPESTDAADIRFQHFAVVVGDIQDAYDRVRREPGCMPISQGGPQRLPPSDGSVMAWKFRDPDGHPLELLQFVKTRKRPGHTLKTGIDHSGIVVADVARSVAFYTELLGLTVAARTHNAGPAQQRLDGLARADVEVIALNPAQSPTPHIELLGYRLPQSQGSAEAPLRDIAATRLLLDVDDMPPLLDRLRRADVAIADAAGAPLIRDPDGHAIVLLPA
jgi:catechol 2,3-dioxygenase-like lactoylglutathione lyase family enzyme